MAQKIFKRIGLRRDKNLSDVSNPVTSLNSLLDTLVDFPGSTFISQDLDCIRNLFAEGMRNSNFLEFAGSSVQFTNQGGLNVELFPRVTYQNRLDKFEIVSGVPRLQGGDGLSAKYFNFDQVQDAESASNTPVSSDDIFVGASVADPIPDDQLWENGEFQYTGKIHPSSVNAAGGVKWEGFYVPVKTAEYRFNISSTASFSFDFETEGYTTGVGTYRELARVSSGTTKSAVISTASPNSITLNTATDERFVGVGMAVTCLKNGSPLIRPGTLVAGTSTTGVISLENPNGDAVVDNGDPSGESVSFSRDFGEPISKTLATYVLEEGRRYRIRARFYIPQYVNAQRIERNILFDHYEVNTSARDLFYYNLYNLNYDFSESSKGDINTFLDNSVRFGGGLLGGTTQPEYIKVRSTKKVDCKYQPPTSFGDTITSTLTNVSFSNQSQTVTTNANTTNIEVGNYVFPDTVALAENTRVNDIIVNFAILLDQLPPGSFSRTGATMRFVDHRGFVDRINSVNCSGGVLSTSGNTSVFGKIKRGMIALSSGDEIVAYTKVTDVTPTSCTLDPAPSNFTNRTIHFYHSRGLVNDSLESFCVPATTKCKLITADAVANGTNNVLVLANLDGIQTGTWTVQGSGIADNTTITGTNPGTLQVTLSNPLVANMKSGATVTVTQASGDRQLCCPPTDTSPPFEATDDGLSTRTDRKHLTVDNGAIKFDLIKASVKELDYTIAGQLQNNFTKFSTGSTTNKQLEITCANGNFGILLED